MIKPKLLFSQMPDKLFLKIAHTVSLSRPVVYFIEDVKRKYVKIGTTRELRGRLNTLNCSSPVKLTLRHFEPGGSAHERWLHERFKKYRVNGEWFHLSDEIVEYMDEQLFICLFTIEKVFNITDEDIAEAS